MTCVRFASMRPGPLRPNAASTPVINVTSSCDLLPIGIVADTVPTSSRRTFGIYLQLANAFDMSRLRAQAGAVVTPEY